MIRILVTAFGAFPGAPVNPTMAIAAFLQRRKPTLRRAGIDIETAVLPVLFEGTRERLAAIIERLRPDAILHLGLAGRRSCMSVETRALNRLTILHPDASRAHALSRRVETGASGFRRSRLPAARLCTTMSRAGAPARLSIDAGDYLCNQVLFLSLGLFDGPCGFIHIPGPRRLRRPVRNRLRDEQRPGLPAIAAAIEAAVRQIAANTRSAAIWA